MQILNISYIAIHIRSYIAIHIRSYIAIHIRSYIYIELLYTVPLDLNFTYARAQKATARNIHGNAPEYLALAPE